MYAVIPSPQFRRAYRKLDTPLQNEVDRTIGLLSDNPRHPSLHTHKRRGKGEVWQARVTRNCRLYFLMEGDTLTLISVGPHEK